MPGLSYLRQAIVAICLFAAPLAHAQSSPTPQQIQALIAGGQEPLALADLQTVLQAHPNSGVAWYLTAEAQDAAGNEAAARSALANAEQYAPGLPFADPAKAAALQAHLNGVAAPQHHGPSPLTVIFGLVLLFLLIRFFLRGRRPAYPGAYGPGYAGGPADPFHGPGPMPGAGSALLSGLAAGAGFAVGERVIDDMMGGNRGIDPSAGFGGNVPDFDDGLQGSPGWDDGNSGQDNSGNFDPNNNW